jgi:6-phospho-3-hexuloisomerase
MDPFQEIYDESTSLVLRELETTLPHLDAAQIKSLIDKILCSRKVFVVGVGRVMLALQAFVKRLAHLGIDAHYVGEITEPAITGEDLLIAASGSGESIFPKDIAKKAKALGATVIHIGSNTQSGIKEYSDGMVRIPVRTKLDLPEEIASEQPMSSLFEQSVLLLGDIIALIIIRDKGLDISSLWAYHANLE